MIETRCLKNAVIFIQTSLKLLDFQVHFLTFYGFLEVGTSFQSWWIFVFLIEVLKFLFRYTSTSPKVFKKPLLLVARSYSTSCLKLTFISWSTFKLVFCLCNIVVSVPYNNTWTPIGFFNNYITIIS